MTHYIRVAVEAGILKVQHVTDGKAETLLSVDAERFELRLQPMPFNANAAGAAIIKFGRPQVYEHLFHIGSDEPAVDL